MSTAVDTAFEELMSADADAAEPLHLVCVKCWPNSVPAGIEVALCGHRATGNPPDLTGRHRCAKCIALKDITPLPCGHP